MTPPRVRALRPVQLMRMWAGREEWWAWVAEAMCGKMARWKETPAARLRERRWGR